MVDKDILIWLWQQFNHKGRAYLFSLRTKKTMMALSLKWDEMPQAASCGDFLAIGTHSSFHKHKRHRWFDGTYILLQPSGRTQLPCHQSLRCEPWLFDLWCTWVMNKFIGWQRQLRISHSCLDSQAARKLFSCSDIRLYVTDKVTVSVLNWG